MKRPRVLLRAGLLALGCSLSPVALAGDGPWTLGEGDQNIYAGVDYFRYASFLDGDGDEQHLSTGVTATGLTGVYTLGLANNFEVEIKVPLESVRVNRPEEDSSCANPPRKGFCETTTGVGDIALALKGNLVSERYVSPVSVSGSIGLRSGEAYAGKRGRLTTLGDGQTDLGAGLSVGRTDILGKGWYRAAMTGWYYYRFANGEVSSNGSTVKVPSDDITFSLTSTFAPWSRFGVGPVVYGFQRMGGVSFSEADLSTMDGFASLRASQIQAGGELGVYSRAGGPTVSFAVLRTIYARNNPSDTLVVSMGLGWYVPGRSADLLEEIRID